VKSEDRPRAKDHNLSKAVKGYAAKLAPWYDDPYLQYLSDFQN